MKTAIKSFCSKLYNQDGIVSLFYSSHVTPMHKHNALQLVFDLKNEFLFRTNYTEWAEYKCLVIKEGTNHQIATNNSLQLILYLDEMNPIAKTIMERYLVYNDFYEPNISLSLSEEISLQQHLLNSDTTSFFITIRSFLNRMIDDEEKYLNDSRITSVLKLVKETAAADLSIEYLSNRIYISSSRLRTLFRNCTGFSLHQYILRIKIFTAINQMVNGYSIQDAAYYAGFNDSSHFNKMLKKIFNVKPSQFLKENSYKSEANETKFIFRTELA